MSLTPSFWADTSSSEDDDFPDLNDLLRNLPIQQVAENKSKTSDRCNSLDTSISEVAPSVSNHPISRASTQLQRNSGIVNKTPRRRPRVIYDSDDDEPGWEVPDSTESQKPSRAHVRRISIESCHTSPGTQSFRIFSEQSSERLDKGTAGPASRIHEKHDYSKEAPSSLEKQRQSTDTDDLGIALATLILLSSSSPTSSVKAINEWAKENNPISPVHNDGSSGSKYFSCESSPVDTSMKLFETSQKVRDSIHADRPSKGRISSSSSSSSAFSEGIMGIRAPYDEPDEESDSDSAAILTYSPPPRSARRPMVLKELIIPPQTPSAERVKQKIPRSPFRESNIAFWDEQKNAAWIDEHFKASPLKTPVKVLGLREPAVSKPRSPKKSSHEIEQDKARKQFLVARERLATMFLAILQAEVCPTLLNILSCPVEILWSKTLISTAGRATYSKTRKTAKIELSTKVIDCEARLRSTMAHEMCHILVWCIDAQFSNPHGKEFKKYGALIEKTLGIKVETTHDYDINYKYQWKCLNETCSKIYGRHSRSIDPRKSVCSLCRSKLEQILPKPRALNTPAKLDSTGCNGFSPCKNAGLMKYQVFLKDNIERIKSENPGLKYAEVIKLVASEYAESKSREGSRLESPPEAVS